MITDPLILTRLADRFGDDRVWSASQLETYSQCPFLYFVQRVLWLDDHAEAEEETTALTFGGAAHDILEAFYRQYQGPWTEGLTDDGRALLHEVAGGVFERREREQEEWLGLPVLWSITRRDILHRLDDFLDRELSKEFLRQRPLLEEVEFGIDQPFTLEGTDAWGGTVRMRLRGRIDRIDQDLHDGSLYVIDYKSGQTPTQNWYRDGSALQIPLYVRVAGTLLDREVSRGSYRSIKNRTMNAAAVGPDQDDLKHAVHYAMSVPARVRAGVFDARTTGSRGWPGYWPGQAITRSTAVLTTGLSRFDD